jgi:hypothetical protein
VIKYASIKKGGAKLPSVFVSAAVHLLTHLLLQEFAIGNLTDCDD